MCLAMIGSSLPVMADELPGETAAISVDPAETVSEEAISVDPGEELSAGETAELPAGTEPAAEPAAPEDGETVETVEDAAGDAAEASAEQETDSEAASEDVSELPLDETADETPLNEAAEEDWAVSFEPVKNTTTTTVKLEGFTALKEAGEADSVAIDAVMSYGGKTTRSVSQTIAFADFAADGTKAVDLGDYGKWSVTVRFLKEGSEVHKNEAVTAGIIADSYNISPVSATLPVTFFSLNLWGDNSIRNKGPVILMMERPSAYDWGHLPEGVYGIPYMTKEEVSYQPGSFSEAGKHFKAIEQVMVDYVKDLMELDPTSFIHLYCVDVYCELIPKILYANQIPEDQYDITMMSDGSFTFAQFTSIYSTENPAARDAQLVSEWNAAKAYAYENGAIDPSFTHNKCKDYIWAIAEAEPNLQYWVTRKDLFKTETDENAFGRAAQASSKLVQVNINGLLTSNIKVSEQNTTEFKGLYNFNDSYFEEAKNQGKDAMVFLGTRVNTEPNFESYAKFVMTYYGDNYVYYYKGHPGTPTDLFPEKIDQLDRLGVTDVDSSVAAELILFFNPEIYLSGYASSTYQSVPVGMGKGMFNMTKATGTADPQYVNMEFWMSRVTDGADEKVKALCIDGNESYLVEFNDTVTAEKGYDIAIWDATIPEIRYYKADEEGNYELIGTESGITGKAVVAPGVYVIGSALQPDMVLDVAGGSTAKKANVQLYKYNATSAQQWEVSYDESGYAVIKNVKSGMVLDAAGGKTAKKTNIQQYKNNGSAAQKWVLTRQSDGTITISSSITETAVFDVAGGKAVKKANIQLYKPNGTKAQKWNFYPVDPAVSSKGQADLEEGYYTIGSAVNPQLLVQVQKLSQSANGNIQVGTASDKESQIFKISQTEDGFYQIQNVWSGLYVAAEKGRIIPTTNVLQVKTVTDNAKWAITQKTGGSYVLRNVKSGLNLDLYGGTNKSGTNVATATPGGVQAQRWIITAAKDPQVRMDEIAEANRDALEDGIYTIYAGAKSSMVLDVKGGSTANKANIQLYKYNKTIGQTWIISHDDKGYITIKNLGSGKVVDVAGGKKVMKSNIQQYKSNGTAAQKWIALAQEDGTYVLASALSDSLVFDVAGGKLVKKSNVQAYKANGSDAQKFRFKKLG